MHKLSADSAVSMQTTRVPRWLLLVWVGFSLGQCTAQNQAATDSLEHGRLVIWVVGPSSGPQRTADQERAQLHTSTAGSFGRAASTVGRTAGSYGQSASTLPTVTKGQTASEIGQTAGSFGNDLSTIAAASAVASGAVAPTGTAPVFEPATLGRDWEQFARRLKDSFGNLTVSFVPVKSVDLRERFAAIGRGVGQPDLLMSGGDLRQQNPFLADLTVTSLGLQAEGALPLGSRLQTWDSAYRQNWLILSAATHPQEARAFVIWLEDGMRAHAELQPHGEAIGGPASLAVSAVQGAMSGGEIGYTDPEAARVPAGAMRSAAFSPPLRNALNGLAMRVDVLTWAANERFAVYALRCIASSPQAFGVAHPLVVLRRSEDGRWRVLQMTANLAPDRQAASFAQLQPFARSVQPQLVKAVAGVTLAAPPDGDARSGLPELWWDNPGDARMLAVEWQRSLGDTHLFLVPDNGTRLQVRVSATFVNVPDVYRWRVWSVGTGGMVKLSPWRKMTVTP